MMPKSSSLPHPSTRIESARTLRARAARLDACGRHAAASEADDQLRECASNLGPAQRTASSVFNNAWNAIALGLHKNDPQYVLSTMITQIQNLLTTVKVNQPYLLKDFNSPQIGATAERLVGEILQALTKLQSQALVAPTAVRQPVPHTASHAIKSTRLASAETTISSNAQAALGVMQWLTHQEPGQSPLFPGGTQILDFVTKRINLLVGLMNGQVPASNASLAADGIAQSDAKAGIKSVTPSPPNDPTSITSQEAYQGLPQTAMNTYDPSHPTNVPQGYAGYEEANPYYNRQDHIQRYMDYMAAHGYDNMVQHLKQFDGGDPAFVRAVMKQANDGNWRKQQWLLDQTTRAQGAQFAPYSGGPQYNPDSLFNDDGSLANQ